MERIAWLTRIRSKNVLLTNAYHKFVDITHYRHIYGFMSGYKFVLQSNCRRLLSNDLDKQLCGPDTSISFAVDSCTSKSRRNWLVLLLPSIELSSLKFILFYIYNYILFHRLLYSDWTDWVLSIWMSGAGWTVLLWWNLSGCFRLLQRYLPTGCLCKLWVYLL